LKGAISLGILLAVAGILFWLIPPDSAAKSETWPEAHVLLTVRIFLGAVSAIAYGVRPPTSSSSRLEIIAGHFLAVILGFFGIAVGLFLVMSRKRHDRFHGAVILLIAAIVTAPFLWNVLLG
jgi:hypothetical protein